MRVCDRASINHVSEQFVTDKSDHPRHSAAKQTRRQMTQLLLIRHGSVNRRLAICFDERGPVVPVHDQASCTH